MLKYLFVVSLSLAGVGTGLGQTVSLTPPAADTFVSGANPGANYGKAGAEAISGSATSKGEFDSLLRFNFATAKSSFDILYGVGGWSLQTVTLTLTAQAPTNLLFNSSAAGQLGFRWLQSDAWVEGTGTPNTPTADGIAYSGLAALQSGADETVGTFAFDGGTTGTRTFAFTLSPGFRTDATTGSVVSFLIQPADSTVSALFAANGTNIPAGDKPVLTVTAAPLPEPGSAALMFAGALLLCRRLRRRAEA
ncbi:MAG: hypothetical protein WCF18_15535 [Chthoniobacteraceae bacterium]